LELELTGRERIQKKTLGNNYRRKDDDYSHDSNENRRTNEKSRAGRHERRSSSERYNRSQSPRSNSSTSDAENALENADTKVNNINKSLFTPAKDGTRNAETTNNSAKPKLLISSICRSENSS